MSLAEEKLESTHPLPEWNGETLQRSFEAMWYQAEVLHKREIDVLKEQKDFLFKRIEKVDESNKQHIQDSIYQFSKDIIATMKEMLANIQEEMIQMKSEIYILKRVNEKLIHNTSTICSVLLDDSSLPQPAISEPLTQVPQMESDALENGSEMSSLTTVEG